MTTWTDGPVTVHVGDALTVLREMPAESIDALVTDPPAGISFMGKLWDHDHGGRDGWVKAFAAIFAECLRVLKPGAHGLVWALPRTSHWTATALEDAGFEIRDIVHHHFGSGFPKSLDVSKAIDKTIYSRSLWEVIRQHLREWRDDAGLTNGELNERLGAATNGGGRAVAWLSEHTNHPEIPSKAQWMRLKNILGWPDCELDRFYAAIKDGADRPVISERRARRSGEGWTDASGMFQPGDRTFTETAPATDAARQWQGWGTALKPATERWVLARKPIPEAVQITARLQWLKSGISSAAATSRYLPEAINIGWSTVSSWSAIWDDLSNGGSTSIIETASSPTTDWRILSYWLSEITPDIIIAAVTENDGRRSLVATVDSLWSGYEAISRATQALSAIETATSSADSSEASDDGSLGAETEHGTGPGSEDIILVRKPLSEPNIASQVLATGTGAMNIDGCRVVGTWTSWRRQDGTISPKEGRSSPLPMNRAGNKAEAVERNPEHSAGRWPSNLVLSHGAGCDGECEPGCPVAELDRQSGRLTSGRLNGRYDRTDYRVGSGATYGDSGGASRFFYTAKASSRERNAGLPEGSRNCHPTVKPVELMRYLCRLVTPPGGCVLDPFMGSGTTGVAARLEGFGFVGIDKDPESVKTAKRRLAHWQHEPELLEMTEAPARQVLSGAEAIIETLEGDSTT